MRSRSFRRGLLVVITILIATAAVIIVLYQQGAWVRSGARFADPATPTPDCLLAYPGFCAFLASMNDLIIAGDIDGILEHTEQKICPEHDEGIDIGCQPGELYVRFAVIQGEVWSDSVDRLRSTWAGAAGPPRQIRGLCDTPDVLACSQGPAILVRTSDDKWDWIFQTRQDGGEWIIHTIAIQRRPYEDLQIPPEYILPWPSP